MINYLFRSGPAPVPVWLGDVNCDGIVNIGDVVYLINYLYKQGPPPCEPDSTFLAKVKASPAVLTLRSSAQSEAGPALFIDGEFDVDASGLQVELEWDRERLELSSISSTVRTKRLGLYHNNGKGGRLKVGVVDIDGKEHISAGKGPLLRLQMRSKSDSLDFSSIEIKKAIIVDQKGRKHPVELVNRVGVSNLPKQFSLSQNYPNLFNPQTVIQYAPPRACHVKIVIYNILGQKVRTLVDEHQGAGYRRLE